MNGFMQVPGIDYTEYFSPVTRDTTIRIALVLTLFHTTWTCETMDAEEAFLNPMI